MPYTSRERHPDEMKGSALYHFVSERAMKAEINAHRYIEFGKHKQHLYGGLSSRSDRVRMHVCTGCKPSGHQDAAKSSVCSSHCIHQGGITTRQCPQTPSEHRDAEHN